MIKGKEPIKAYFETQGKPYFAIYYKGKVESGNSIYTNDSKGKENEIQIDFEIALRKFDELLGWLSAGDYTLIVNDKPGVTQRGCNKVDFNISVSESMPGHPGSVSPGVPAITGVSLQEVEQKATQIAESKFRQMMQEKELQDLKERNKELEKENKELEKAKSEPINKFLGAISPHAPDIISGLMGRPMASAPISGIKPDETGNTDLEGQKLFEDFAESLVNARPNDWKVIIQKLTSLINNDPAKFQTALNFL